MKKFLSGILLLGIAVWVLGTSTAQGCGIKGKSQGSPVETEDSGKKK